MAHITEIKAQIHRRYYAALQDAGLRDLNEISGQGLFLQRTPGIGKPGCKEILKALRAYEAAKGIQLAYPRQHPLVAFGLALKYAERLMLAEWYTVEEVIRHGKYATLAGRIGFKGLADINKAVGAWRLAAKDSF